MEEPHITESQVSPHKLDEIQDTYKAEEISELLHQEDLEEKFKTETKSPKREEIEERGSILRASTAIKRTPDVEKRV
jgi:hypothetical protein